MPVLEVPGTRFVAPETKLAYYSLLQYEPDHMRQERINVAILLEAPSYGFRAARFLRHMHKRVREFDPTISEQVIYYVAKSLEEHFTSGPDELTARPIDYVDVPKPDGICNLIGTYSAAAHSLWRLTEPKPIVINASHSFERELERLYTRLVQTKSTRLDEPGKDKDYVRKATVSELQRREIDLTLNPLPVPGEMFEENSFDAVYQSGFAAYLQFLSFDTSTSALDQAKAFITARRDVGDHVNNSPVEYIAIVQRPEHIRTAHNVDTYERALTYFAKSKIRQVPAEHRGFDLVAHGLRGDLETFRTTFQPG